MAYSSSSLSKEVASYSLRTFLALRASSVDKSLDSSIAVNFGLHLVGRALKKFDAVVVGLQQEVLQLPRQRFLLRRLRSDVVVKSLTPSLERLRRRCVMPVKSSPYSMSTILQEIWCRANPADIFTVVTGITCITVNGKNAYELKGKLLNDLHNNAFDGTNGEEAVKHIEYFFRIVDPIDLPNVNHDKLRVVNFLISLVGGARRWFDKIKESIDRWDPTNPNFENWLASKFVNYKTMDIFAKGALWDYWKMGSDEVEPTDDESSNLG
ncbi:hypothetical protein Tco_0728139 [Tanacetum coccineum]|uniref:Retrotransposon gag domain-containing protein n=1 Tax=Tanacetum coccineum TaxID=301880 RepID=A0ABQ4YNC8_9ASTR